MLVCYSVFPRFKGPLCGYLLYIYQLKPFTPMCIFDELPCLVLQIRSSFHFHSALLVIQTSDRNPGHIGKEKRNEYELKCFLVVLVAVKAPHFIQTSIHLCDHIHCWLKGGAIQTPYPASVPFIQNSDME